MSGEIRLRDHFGPPVEISICGKICAEKAELG